MNQPDKSQIISFVENKYGEQYKNNLLNITQGGSNNQKGRDYENQFMLYKVFEIAAKYPHDCEKQIIETQPIAFVDDICHIDYKESIKYNYQAKNSSSSSADWTDETTKRFRMQRAIDKALFGVSGTKNILLVSDQDKRISNESKIPSDLKGKDFSEYFEYHETNYSLLTKTDLSKYIESLTAKQSQSTHEYALTLVAGILQSGDYRTIKDVFTQADFEGHPSPFVSFQQSRHELPSWVKQILTNNSHCVGYEVSYNTLIVTVNKKFVATCNLDTLCVVPAERAQNVCTPWDLVRLFLELTGSDIEKSLDASTRRKEND